MNKIAMFCAVVVLPILPAFARADSLTSDQQRACRWSGGLAPAEVANVFEASGQYLGHDQGFSDRVLVGYSFSEDTGVVVGFMPGSRGGLISYSLEVVGFAAPAWFSEDCRAIAKEYLPTD